MILFGVYWKSICSCSLIDYCISISMQCPTSWYQIPSDAAVQFIFAGYAGRDSLMCVRACEDIRISVYPLEICQRLLDTPDDDMLAVILVCTVRLLILENSHRNKIWFPPSSNKTLRDRYTLSLEAIFHVHICGRDLILILIV